MRNTIISKITAALVLGMTGTLLAGGNAPDTLKFSHKKHITEAEVSCLDCHQGASENAGGGKRSTATHASCEACHADQIQGECVFCHTNADNAKASTFVVRHKSFSHKAHAGYKAECVTCHKGLDKADKAGAANFPAHDECFSCHNDKKARRECSMCHTDLSKIKPKSHKSLRFLREEHGRSARLSSASCDQCHEQRTCDQCHTGQLSIRIHEPNYAVTHGLEARRQDKNCQFCHEIQRPCISCHTGRR